MAAAVKKKVKLPTSFKVGSVLSAASLKMCLVALFDDRVAEIAKRLAITPRKAKEQGLVALALCKAGCFFCGSSQKMSKLAFPDRNAALCTCTKSLRSGYRELRPGWKEEVAKATFNLPRKELNKPVTPAMKAAWLKASSELLRVFNGARTPLYSDQCVIGSCRATFIIDSGKVAGAVRGYGPYNRSSKCVACREKKRVEEAAAKKLAEGTRQPTATEVAAAEAPKVTPRGAKPKKVKKVREYVRPIPPDIAAQNNLEVSLGELLRSKKIQEA